MSVVHGYPLFMDIRCSSLVGLVGLAGLIGLVGLVGRCNARTDIVTLVSRGVPSA